MTRPQAQSEFNIAPSHASVFAELGLTCNSVFTDPRIKVWRELSDRENATLDFEDDRGTPVRLHIKRYPTSAIAKSELHGYKLLKSAGIPAAPIVASGFCDDGRSFIILQDLAGYTPADKLLAQGFDFERLLNPTADLAAKLHDQHLHHRDLYLCHFMVRATGETVEAKLIDMARVNRMTNPLTRRRWIVKDLAQFWFSSFNLPVTERQRETWLRRYCESRQIPTTRLIGPITQKAATIARHDAELRKRQPGRNVSITDQELRIEDGI